MFEGLKGTGRFPRLTLELVAQEVRAWPSAERTWPQVVERARGLPSEAVHGPGPWLQAQLRQLDLLDSGRAGSGGENQNTGARAPQFGPPAGEM